MIVIEQQKNIEYSFEKIEQITSEILLKYNMFKVPVDVIELANKENIEVYETELEENSGMIVYNNEKNRYDIVLNNKLEKNEKKNVIANELAFYYLYKSKLDQDEIHCFNNVNDNDEYITVEYFSQALLMNKILLKRLFCNVRSIRKLSEIFDVTTSYMTKRLDELELL